MSYLKTIGIALDQLGMAVCGGNEDCTISATVGYFVEYDISNYWLLLEWIINTTYYPIDGEDHCDQALAKDRDEDFTEGYKIPLLLLVVVSCLIISIFTYSYYLFKRWL